MLAILLVTGFTLGSASDAGSDLPQLLAAWWTNGPRTGLDQALEGRLQQAVAGHLCTAPTQTEASAQIEQLRDFEVLRTTPVGVSDGGEWTVLHAEPLSPAERADLGYLRAAMGFARPPARPDKVTPETPAQTKLRAAVQAAIADRDVARVLTAGRSYLAALDPSAKALWVLPWDAAAVVADIALAEEVAGDPERVGEINRRLAAEIWCGNCAEGFVRHQAEARIRAAEASGHCRDGVVDRLALAGRSDAAYGPERLADAGFEVSRLYRGALATLNRRDAVAVAQALQGSPAGLARLAREGTEDLFDQARPVPGLLLFSGADGVLPVLQAATGGMEWVRAWTLDVLDRLIPEPLRCSRRRSKESGGYGQSCVRSFGSLGALDGALVEPLEAEALTRDIVEGALAFIHSDCPRDNAPHEKCTELQRRLLGLSASARDSEDHGPWQQPGEDPYEASARHVEAQLTPKLVSFSVVSCRPPKPEALASTASSLTDFFVLRRRKQTLVAEPLTATDRGDLAYFLAAVQEEAGPPTEATGAWNASAEERAERQVLLRAVSRPSEAGVPGLQRAARRYLETDGYPGPLRGWDDGERIAGRAAQPIVARALAGLDELLGSVPEALDLYRRLLAAEANLPLDAHKLRLMRDLIRSAQMSGQCPSAIAERLFDPTETERQNVYGPSSLSAIGFDVPRLYRGALLTQNRGSNDGVRAALASLPRKEASPALARFSRRGLEAWEPRVRALEGLADTVGLDAIPALLQAAQTMDLQGAQRAIAAISALIPQLTDSSAEGTRAIHTWVWEPSDRRLADDGLRDLARRSDLGPAIERLRRELHANRFSR